jgi:hypothetical protein
MVRPDPVRKLSANVYGVYRCCVYSEKLLMMDRGTVRNMNCFIPKNKFEKLVLLVGFIIRTYHDARSPERQIQFFSLCSGTFYFFYCILFVALDSLFFFTLFVPSTLLLAYVLFSGLSYSDVEIGGFSVRK